MKKKLFFIFLLISAIFIPFKVNAEAVGVTTLEELQTAMAAGGEIRLDADINVTTAIGFNKAATLDLNGHTLDLNNKTLAVYRKVTIIDSSTNQSGKITSTASFAVQVGHSTIATSGNLIVKGGTIEGRGLYGAIRNYETLEIDGGTVVSNTTYSTGFTVYNQKTLIMKSGTIHSINKNAIQAYTNSTFQMDGGTVVTDAVGEVAINMYGDCSVIINGGTVEALQDESAAIAIFGNTELTINGGTITGHDMAIIGNGNEVSGNVNITINDGTIRGIDAVGMYLPQRNSTTTINGGIIEGPTAIEIRAGDLIVNNGTITGTSDIYEVIENANGNTTKGAAIGVSQHTTKQPINVTINGSNLKAVVPLCEVNPQNNPKEAIDLIKIEVTQGNFESTEDESLIIGDGIEIPPFIEGGTYTNDPTNYVKEGYGVIEIPTGYEVTKIHTITIDEKSKDLITLDETEAPYKKSLKFKKIKDKIGYFTIIEMYDTNGNKLNVEVKDNEFIMPDADIIIKVNYKKMVNPPTSDNIYINVLLLLISTIGLTIITKKTLKA